MRVATLVRAAGSSGHDRVRVLEYSESALIVLCDGTGGVAGGADAADLVSNFLARPGFQPPGSSTAAFLAEMLTTIDCSPFMPASAGLTTAVVAWIAHGKVTGASVGDSEAWLVRRNDYVELTEMQYRGPLIGSRRCYPVAFGPIELDGTLIIGSDGLFKHCDRANLLRLARSADYEVLPELLLGAAKPSTGKLRDNFSVAVYRN